MADGEIWLRDLRRRAPDGRLARSPDDLFAGDANAFTRAFERRDGYYLVGLANGHVWRCTGLRLASTEGDLVRLLNPKLLHPAVDSNLLAGADVRISEISWVADSKDA